MKVRDGASIIMCLFFVVFMIYANLYIFSETGRQKQRIQTEQVPQEEVKRRKKDNKAASTVVIILAALLISYLPAIIAAVFFVVRFSEHSTGDSKELNAVNVAVSWSTTSLVLLGSLVNPIIYCWRSKKLRRVFFEILHLKKPQNSSQRTEMNSVQRHRPEIYSSSNRANFPVPVERQEQV